VRTTTAGNCTVESSAFRTLIFVFVPNFGFASNHQFEMNRIRKYVVVVAVRTPNGLGPNTPDSVSTWPRNDRSEWGKSYAFLSHTVVHQQQRLQYL
jgi:hypothetical protein